MKELTETVFRAMNGRDFELYEEIISEEVSFDFPGAGRVDGKRRTILLLKAILRRYPVLRFTG